MSEHIQDLLIFVYPGEEHEHLISMVDASEKKVELQISRMTEVGFKYVSRSNHPIEVPDKFNKRKFFFWGFLSGVGTTGLAIGLGLTILEASLAH